MRILLSTILCPLLALAFLFNAAAEITGWVRPCPEALNSLRNLEVGRLSIRGLRVTWNGKVIRSFAPGRQLSELALLKLLAAHPDQIFATDDIVRAIFPSLMLESPEARILFIKEIKYRLLCAFRDMPDFDAIQTAKLRGYFWHDSSLIAEPTIGSGNVRMTATEVFWKGQAVPGFGPTAVKRRRALQILLENVDQFVEVPDVARAVVIELRPSAPADQFKKMAPLFTVMQDDFKSVDPNFNALDFSVEGMRWSEAKEIPRPIVFGNLKILSRRFVSWQGVALQLNQNQFDLLYFLASHPNQFFAYDTILERAFPPRMNDELKSRLNFLHTTKRGLHKAFEAADPAFEAIQNASAFGYAFSEINAPATLVRQVGSLVVTSDAVFWRGKLLQGFGPEQLEKRRILLVGLDKENLFVATKDPDDQKILRNIAKDFERADPSFSALKIFKNKGFAWSESGVLRDEKYLAAGARTQPAKRYRFLGQELKLDRTSRILLEVLLKHAPEAASRAELFAALLDDQMPAKLFKWKIYCLRRIVGTDSVDRVGKEGFRWAAPTRPEVISSDE